MTTTTKDIVYTCKTCKAKIEGKFKLYLHKRKCQNKTDGEKTTMKEFNSEKPFLEDDEDEMEIEIIYESSKTENEVKSYQKKVNIQNMNNHINNSKNNNNNNKRNNIINSKTNNNNSNNHQTNINSTPIQNFNKDSTSMSKERNCSKEKKESNARNASNEFKLYDCPICDLTFTSESSRYQHKKKDHRTNQTDKTGKTFPNSKDEQEKSQNIAPHSTIVNKACYQNSGKDFDNNIESNLNSNDDQEMSKKIEEDDQIIFKEVHYNNSVKDFDKSIESESKIEEESFVKKKLNSRTTKVDCPICQLKMSNKFNLIRHLKSFHSDSREDFQKKKENFQMRLKKPIERLIVKKSWTRKIVKK